MGILKSKIRSLDSSVIIINFCININAYDNYIPQLMHSIFSIYYIILDNYSSLTAPNIQHTANQERNDQCGNQHYSRELLMMGIVVPETC